MSKLSTVMPDVKFYYEHDFDSPLLDPKNVKGIHFGEFAEEDVYLSIGRPHYLNDAAPLVLVLLETDYIAFPKINWWSFRRIIKDPIRVDVNRATSIIVPSKRIRKSLLNHYDISPAKIIVVGHGLPSDELRITPADSVTRRITKEVYGKEHSYFLAPCYGHPSDNLERLFAAYDIFRERCPEPIQLLVESLGESPSRSVRKAKRAAKFKEDISFLSSLKPSERRKVVSSARAILFPSLSTRFPLPVLDAWTAEVPVLYTDNDILQGAGALVQGEDVNSIAEGIVNLVTTPFLASGLVENGKRRREAFRWETVAQRVAEVIRSVSAST
ncbi:MAG: glycosyltransferase [Bacteroidota bacterium]